MAERYCGTAELATAEDTMALGAKLGAQLRAGDVVVLSGPLGAGKTVLAKGIARAMDVEGPVISPTFVLARVHRARRAGTHAREGDAALGDDERQTLHRLVHLRLIEGPAGVGEQLALQALRIHPRHRRLVIPVALGALILIVVLAAVL